MSDKGDPVASGQQPERFLRETADRVSEGIVVPSKPGRTKSTPAHLMKY